MKPILNLYVFKVDSINLESDLWVRKDFLTKWLTDARSLSKTAEEWAARAYTLQVKPGDQKGYDLIDLTGGQHSVKTLGQHGVKFQDSSHLGKGRNPPTKDEFTQEICSNKSTIVVDITKVPFITLVQVPSLFLSKHLSYWNPGVKKKNPEALTPSGWNKKKFYIQLNQGFELKWWILNKKANKFISKI